MPFKDKEQKREYHKKYMREWYQKNKAKHISYVRNRDKKIKDWLKQYKETLECEKCGETHPACLDFHHINPAEKSFSLGRINKFLSIDLLKSEIAKCNVLCSNCHRKKHWEERNNK
jgi:5-methylcytosine-specific restriction endonuclease McrA